MLLAVIQRRLRKFQGHVATSQQAASSRATATTAPPRLFPATAKPAHDASVRRHTISRSRWETQGTDAAHGLLEKLFFGDRECRGTARTERKRWTSLQKWTRPPRKAASAEFCLLARGRRRLGIQIPDRQDEHYRADDQRIPHRRDVTSI